MLVQDGIVLIKLWLAIGHAEQLRQFLQRESDPLKQWKLSQTDIDGLSRWDDYTAAIAETFERSHRTLAPWTVIWSEDKRRARLAAMQSVLSRLDYPGKAVTPPDPAICSDPGAADRGEETSERLDNDPSGNRYGCFLPDLTGLAERLPAPTSRRRYTAGGPRLQGPRLPSASRPAADCPRRRLRAWSRPDPRRHDEGRRSRHLRRRPARPRLAAARRGGRRRGSPPIPRRSASRSGTASRSSRPPATTRLGWLPMTSPVFAGAGEPPVFLGIDADAARASPGWSPTGRRRPPADGAAPFLDDSRDHAPAAARHASPSATSAR